MTTSLLTFTCYLELLLICTETTSGSIVSSGGKGDTLADTRNHIHFDSHRIIGNRDIRFGCPLDRQEDNFLVNNSDHEIGRQRDERKCGERNSNEHFILRGGGGEQKHFRFSPLVENTSSSPSSS
jgi:hypothetical protein